MAPDGQSFLQAPLRRLFATDESDADFMGGVQVSLAEVIQDSLQRHASGISFTERGAGPGLDRDMTPPGFLVGVSIDWEETGFVRGGNQFNCGTWMDKVGESSWAGNKGVPATPRYQYTNVHVPIDQCTCTCVLYLIHIHVLMLCRKFEFIPIKIGFFYEFLKLLKNQAKVPVL